MMIAVITGTLFFVAKSKLSHFLILGLGSVLAGLLLILVSGYRVDRITSFTSAEADPSAEGQSACRAAVLSALADTGTMVADAREGAKRIGVITGDIKLFSRGDDVRMGPVDTHAVIESTARMCWNEIRPPGAPDQGLWGCACGTGL